MPPKAKAKRMPIDGSTPYRPVGVPKMSTTSENGRIAIIAAAVIIEITGASANSQPLAPSGRNWALKTSLPMSAIACSRPNGPTRFGP